MKTKKVAVKEAAGCSLSDDACVSRWWVRMVRSELTLNLVGSELLCRCLCLSLTERAGEGGGGAGGEEELDKNEHYRTHRRVGSHT